jgi:hypothetical protein
LFELFALGDVGIATEDTERFAIRHPRKDLALIENPFMRSILAPHAVFIGTDRGLALDVSLKIIHELRPVVWMDGRYQFIEAAADFALRIPEQVLPSVGEKDPIRGGIPFPHTNAAAFESERPVFVAET